MADLAGHPMTCFPSMLVGSTLTLGRLSQR